MRRSGKEYKDEVLPTEATQWTQSQQKKELFQETPSETV